MATRGVAARCLAALVVVILAASSAAPVAAQTAPSTSSTLTVVGSTVAAGTPGRIGIDLIYERGGAGVYDIWPCTHHPTLPQLGWGTSGRWEGRTSFSRSRRDWGLLTTVRLELYPHPCGLYDPWSGDVGGAHVQRTPTDGEDWLNVGRVPLPRPSNGAFPIRGRLRSSTPLPDNRVEFDVFQVAYGYPDTSLSANLPRTRRTSTGADSLAFATSANRGSRWTGHWGWPGRYILFIRDTATDRHVHGFVEIREGQIPTIDLDAVCFGLDTCVYDRGGPEPVSGGFHPLTPTRIVDTRAGQGLPGAIPNGDGRSTSGDARVRRLTSARHELAVLGRHGVPRAGVAAVVLNVTAIDAPRSGYLSVLPRPHQSNIFDDQGTYRRAVGTSNIDVVAGATVSQTVIARVGAGGVVRFANRGGPTHITADLLGWIDNTGDTSAGSGFISLARTNLFDSSVVRGQLAAGSSTRLKVAGVGRVPTDATAVLVDVTATDATTDGYVVMWPGDVDQPPISHLNLQAGQRRSAKVMVPVAADGSIDMAVIGTTAQVTVDIVGAWRPGGPPVTIIDPRRVVDSRRGVGVEPGPWSAGATAGITLPSEVVPTDARSVWLHITAARPTANGRVRVWTPGARAPATPTLWVEAGRTTSKLVLVHPDDQGRLRVGVSGTDAHLMIDVVGYVG